MMDFEKPPPLRNGRLTIYDLKSQLFIEDRVLWFLSDKGREERSVIDEMGQFTSQDAETRFLHRPFGDFARQSVYRHDAAVPGKRFSSSMTVTQERGLSDQLQKTRFLSFSVAPGAKLGTIMPAAPLAMSAFASSHEGGVLPWSARSSQGQAKVAGEKPRLLKLDRSVRSRTGSLSTS
ncbi:hypothetical protein AD948_07100 [Acetobacter senegalensis]|uniref:Uncharacterized protein n=1 Tax=Acetobacter senegalensis TaxID=446692 RepID=A0A149U2Z8_9PROT|nr:hypothetical protein AD948_07100 [Acetobacter senegalensis]